MKHNISDERNILFNLSCKGLKFFMLMLLGLAITFVISQLFGAKTIVEILICANLWEWIARIAVFIFCSFAVSIVYESFH